MGMIELSLAGIDADLAEERLHSEGARLIRNNRNDSFADIFLFQEIGQDANKSHCGRNFTTIGPGKLLLEKFQPGNFQPVGSHITFGGVTAQRRPPLMQVNDLGAVLLWYEESDLLCIIFGHRQIEILDELDEIDQIKFLRLMRQVASFSARRAETISLDGLGENDRRLSLMLGRSSVSVVNLDRIVTTAPQTPDVVIGHMLDKL